MKSLVEAAQRELRSIMGLQAVPLFHSIARWPNAMAQYTVGHEQRLEQIESIVKASPAFTWRATVIAESDCRTA